MDLHHLKAANDAGEPVPCVECGRTDCPDNLTPSLLRGMEQAAAGDVVCAFCSETGCRNECLEESDVV